jgi:hypothetical protein
MADREFPPIQIGGCGNDTGVGSIDIAACGPAVRLTLDRLARPGLLHRVDGPVETRPPIGERRTERGELALEVARGHPEDDPALGQRVQRRHPLGRDERVAVAGDEHVAVEPDPARGRRGDGERDQGVEGVVPALGHPARRRERVVGDMAGVEPRGLGGGGHLHHRGRAAELAGPVHGVGGKRDAVPDPGRGFAGHVHHCPPFTDRCCPVTWLA